MIQYEQRVEVKMLFVYFVYSKKRLNLECRNYNLGFLPLIRYNVAPNNSVSDKPIAIQMLAESAPNA